MKRIIISLMILCLFCACEFENSVEGNKIRSISNYDFENNIPEFENSMEAAHWLQNRIKYISDFEQFLGDYIQSPEEFYHNVNEEGKMKGDCDCITSFFCYLAKTKFHASEIYLVGVEYSYGGKHAISYIDGKYYDIREKGFIIPLNDLKEGVKILFKIPYDNLIWMILNYHRIIIFL